MNENSPAEMKSRELHELITQGHPEESSTPKKTPSTAKKVTWLTVDGWEAIYVNGKLMGEQSENLSPWTWLEVLKELGAEVEDLRYNDEAESLIQGTGKFPETLP